VRLVHAGMTELRGAANSDADDVAFRVNLHPVLSPVFEYQRNGVGETRTGLIPRTTLTVGSRHFGAIGDDHVAVTPEDRGELIVRW
jgi:hypothetical protein